MKNSGTRTGIVLRPLMECELDPTEGEAPVCFHNKKHVATHEGTAPMRGEYFTCLPCAELGLKGVGLNTEFRKILAKEAGH